MHVHEEVLEAARRIARERGDWTFAPHEIVQALPHLRPNSVRTHIVSRCCVNAPSNHPHRWRYFRRTARGRYTILPPMRRGAKRPAQPEPRVSEAAPGAFGRRVPAQPRDTVHVVVVRDRKQYVAECLELAIVTQGHTLDEVVANLREAVSLHLEGESPSTSGVVSNPRISLTYELST